MFCFQALVSYWKVIPTHLALAQQGSHAVHNVIPIPDGGKNGEEPTCARYYARLFHTLSHLILPKPQEVVIVSPPYRYQNYYAEWLTSESEVTDDSWATGFRTQIYLSASIAYVLFTNSTPPHLHHPFLSPRKHWPIQNKRLTSRTFSAGLFSP